MAWWAWVIVGVLSWAVIAGFAWAVIAGAARESEQERATVARQHALR